MLIGTIQLNLFHENNRVLSSPLWNSFDAKTRRRAKKKSRKTEMVPKCQCGITKFSQDGNRSESASHIKIKLS